MKKLNNTNRILTTSYLILFLCVGFITNTQALSHWSDIDKNDNSVIMPGDFSTPADAPTSLTFFKVSPTKNSSIHTEWKTQNEAGISHYDIERSTNGIEWIPIFAVKANNSSPINHYQYINEKLDANTYHYRVKIMNQDQSHTYSNIKTAVVQYDDRAEITTDIKIGSN